MKKSDALEELIEIVKTLVSVYKEEHLRYGIDFDPNVDMTIVKLIIRTRMQYKRLFL